MNKFKLKMRKFREKLIKGVIIFSIAGLELKGAAFLNNIINKSAIEKYDEVVDDFADYLEKQNITEPLDIFEYYNYALWGGYLSYNHELKYDTSRQIFIDNSGIGCILGDGVCLNYADMLTDIFKEMGYNSFSIYCYVDINGLSINQIRNNKDIVRNINYDESVFQKILMKLTSPIQMISGNHAITCVEYNEEYYFFDPTNLVYLGKTDFDSIKVLNGTGEYKLRYLTSILFNDISNLQTLTSKNDKEYTNYVYSNDEINIDEKSIEKFYNQEMQKYKFIYDQFENKNQTINFIICLYLSAFIIQKLINKILKVVKEKCDDKISLNCIKLNLNVMKFLKENKIENQFDIIDNLNKMIEDGYLSYSEENKKYAAKIFLDKYKAFECLLNKDLHRAEFICTMLRFCNYDAFVINSKCVDSSFEGVSKIFNSTNIQLICIEDEENYYFYDFNKNLLLNKFNFSQLKSMDESMFYKLKTRKKEIRSYINDHKNINNIEINQNKLEDEKMDEFYQKNKELIDSISKTLRFSK